MVSFPTSLDSLTNPASGDQLASVTVPHATQHANANDILEALEAKVGTGSSTPTAATVLAGTGTGSSAWTALLSGSTTFQGTDVALNNTGTWFSGPNTGSIGASGQRWLILATATLLDTAGVARLHARITDGSGVQAETAAVSVGASDEVVVSLSVVVTLSGATTFTLAARDSTSTSGKLLTSETSAGASNLATSITAIRLS